MQDTSPQPKMIALGGTIAAHSSVRATLDVRRNPPAAKRLPTPRLRVIRRTGSSGRPRAAATRSSAESGDSGDDGPSDEGDGPAAAPPGVAGLEAPRTTAVIAAELRREVAAAEADFQSAVQHAIRAGELLIEAKAQVGHGRWLPWLEANFPGSERTARNYMRLARNGNAVADLPPVRDAVGALTEPKPHAASDAPTAAPHTRETAELVVRAAAAMYAPIIEQARLGYARGVHTALGYETWADYVDGERFWTAPDDVRDTMDAAVRERIERDWRDALLAVAA